MTLQDREIRKLVKAEADEFLFDKLHFDAEMQEKVRRLAGDEEMLAGGRQRKTKRGLGYSGIAAVAAAAIALLIVLKPAPVQPPEGTPAVGTPPAVTFQDPHGAGGGGSPGTAGPADKEPRVVNGYEEAWRAFGHGLLVPAVLPDGFSLREINVTGPGHGEATSAAFSYAAGDRSFGVFAQKEKWAKPQRYDEQIDVNGAAGYLIAGEPPLDGQGTPANVELHWYANGVHYMISGLIAPSEAEAVARSMAPLAG